MTKFEVLRTYAYIHLVLENGKIADDALNDSVGA
jgi:hypothetical protein